MKFRKSAVRAVEKIINDDVLGRSAALAFYTVLTMAPLIVLMVSLLATLGWDLQAQLLNEVENLMGSEAASVLQSIVMSANDRPDLSSSSGWIAGLILIFSVSVIFAQLQNTLNIIFATPGRDKKEMTMIQEMRAFLRRRLLSFGMVVSFIFITIVSLAASAALAFVVDNDSESLILRIFSFSTNLVVFTVLFSAIFKILPDRKIGLKNSLVCGFITSLFFIFGKALIGLYLGKTAVGSAYGAAGALVVLLIWLYYSSFIVFIGAEISSLFLMKKDEKNASLS